MTLSRVHLPDARDMPSDEVRYLGATCGDSAAPLAASHRAPFALGALRNPHFAPAWQENAAQLHHAADPRERLR